MKQSKAEEYLSFVEHIYKGVTLRSYGDVMLNPGCMDMYLENKKESMNVWEDVRALINKKYTSNLPYLNYIETGKNLVNIVNARLAYLKGVYKSPLNDNKEKNEVYS